MRILKKILRRLYHLIAFLSLFLIFSPNVHAVGGVVSIDGEQFGQASFASFGDVSNGTVTDVGAVWVDYGHYYRSGTSIITTGGNTNGASVAFDAAQPFVFGYTYVVSVLVGVANGYPKKSDSRVCIAENIANTRTRWNNNMCVSATVTNTEKQSPYNDGSVSYNYGLLNYIFTSNVTGTSFLVDYQTSVRNESTNTFGGYKVTLLSDNKQLTQSQITSAVQNSGLATAQSVTQVQQSITQVQQELGSIDNTLNDSSVDSSDSTINTLKGNIPTNNVISNLILLPVKFLQAIVNSLGGTCSSFDLGTLYNHNLILPCINIQNYLGSTIWTFIDLVFSGMFILVIRKKFIQIYNNLTNLRNGGNEVD